MPPKRRRRYQGHQGLYYHSSPPKVLSMISSQSGNLKREDGTRDGFVIKPSNIRIWIHDKDIRKLTKVIWAGEGNRLRSETSTNPKIKRFLENVPYVLNVIKDVHQAVIDNDLDKLKMKIKSPVPSNLLKTKDANGLTVMHKAAGLAHTSIIEYLLTIWQDGASERDLTGKTPLHWAVTAKNNTRIYNLLVQAGAAEDILDNRMKTALDYKQKPSEIDRSLLTVVPEAPRVPHDSQPDWSLLIDDESKILTTIKSEATHRNQNELRRGSDVLGNGMNLLTTRSRAVSIDKTSESETVEEGNDMNNDDNFMNEKIDQNMNDNKMNDISGDSKIDDNMNLMNGNHNHNQNQNPIDNNNDDENENNDIKNDEKQSDLNLSEKAENTDINDGDDDADINDDFKEDKTHLENDLGSIIINNDEINVNDNENNENLLNDDEMKSENENVNKDENNTINNENNNENIIRNENVNKNDENEKNDIEINEIKSNNVNNEKEATNLVENTENQQVTEDDMNDNDDKLSEENDKNIENESENVENLVEEAKMIIDDDENDDDNEDDDADTELESRSQETESITETTKINEDNSINQEIIENDLKQNEQLTDIESIQNKDTTDSISNDNHDHDSVIINDNNNNNENDLQKCPLPDSTETEEVIDKNEQEINNNNNNNNNESNEIIIDDNNNDNNNNNNNKTNTTEKHNDKNSIDDNMKAENKSNKNDNNEIGDNDEDDDDQLNKNNINIHKIDENHNNENETDSKRSSPSQPLEISGLVQGEADDNQVQSQSSGFGDVYEGNRIQQVIDSGDMEQLAALVLNGEGKKLLNATSSQPEIQAFLDNVQNYMDKIRRVHLAAKNGNLRELQAALDRRKFAIAKDEISPDGASPLHVATIFGHAAIIRYLGGRFPETTNTVDNNGRTPLHYAATINDNGHFYNLLTHLGGNPKAKDKFGHTADFYRNQEESKNILSYKNLLKKFGVNENYEDEMLNDQVPDDVHSARRILDDPDVLSTLERCYRLIHESHRLTDPLGSAPNSASSLRISVTNYLAKFLRRSVFDKIKYRQTRLDHNLFDVIWPAMKKSSKERRIDEDLSGGVIAPDFDVYVVFQEFLVPLIKDMHWMNLSQDFKPHPKMQYFPLIDNRVDDDISLDIDSSGKYILDGFIECARNLEDFELPLNMNIGQIEQAERTLLEKLLTTEFAEAVGDTEIGVYYTMNEVLENPSEIRTVLATSKLLIPLLDNTDPQQEAECLAINGQYWPYGRGVFISNNSDLAIWINVQEHLRLIASTPLQKPGDFGIPYSKIGRAMIYLEDKIQFRQSYLLGYLTSRPSFLGTALKISTTLELLNLIKEIENLRHLCTVRGLNMILNQKDETVRLVNMQSLGITEWRLIQDFCTAVMNIIQLEKDISMTNSKQIAAMLIKIFKRKKNSLVTD